MKKLRPIFLVWLSLMSVLGWVVPVSAEHVSVRASRGDDFGRIVCLWDRPVAHEMAHNGRPLTIRFGRPIEALSKGAGALRSTSIVRPNRDGRSVTFQLTRAFEVFGFDSGNAVIVEFAELTEPAPPLQPEVGEASAKILARKAVAQTIAMRDLPKIRVRTGRHKDYSRIVIDWPRKVEYKFDQKGGVVVVRFSNAADLQVDDLRRRPPPYVGDVRSRPGVNETVLELAVTQATDASFPLRLEVGFGHPPPYRLGGVCCTSWRLTPTRYLRWRLMREKSELDGNANSASGTVGRGRAGRTCSAADRTGRR